MEQILQSIQNNYLHYIYPVVVIIGALLAGFIVEKLIVKKIISEGKNSGWRLRQIFASTSIFANITKIAIYVIGLLLALQSLGISITPILTALGVGGLAVALALQNTLSNLFSGLQIIASKQIKPGDLIKIDSGEQGYVEDITWRNTTIKTIGGNLVIIPNISMASTIIKNYSAPNEDTSVKIDVHIAYDNDLKKTEQITMEVAEEILRSTPGGLENFRPQVRYEEFADAYLKMSVIMRGRKFVDQYLLKHEFIKLLHNRYRTSGIKIVP